MSSIRLYLATLILIIGCQQSGIGQDKPGVPSNSSQAATTIKISDELEIFKNTLLTDPNTQMRTKTANVLLFNEDPAARAILIEALSLTNNSAARMAICRALVQANSSSQPIANKEVFIQPLLGIFATENAEEARLAAQATMIYNYEDIGPLLENLAEDATKPVATRLNAIGALQNQPDERAAIRLLRLVDDPEKQVADGAEKALISLGLLSAGSSKADRSKTIDNLSAGGTYQYLLNLLATRLSEIRQLNTQVESWKKSYLGLLDKNYQGYDDASKGKFLVENLGSTRAVVRLWALEKVSQWRQGTNPNLPTELWPILIGLISDVDRDVRLKTTSLLSTIMMGEVSSAKDLLAQLKVETDEQVKAQLVDTLGWACYNAPDKTSPEIRAEALNWGERFLAEQDTSRAQIGAKVIQRLLERDGLKPEEVDKYLSLLSERYKKQKDNPNNDLRGELLNAMAVLVAQNSSCRVQAGNRFEPIFKEALIDNADSIKETAVIGLINKDNAAALKILRAKNFINDPSENIRTRIIQLARDIGGKEDLTWLAEKIGSNSESQPAWQAMLRIFTDSEADTLNEWIDKLTLPESQYKLSAEQKIAFLEKSEAKATGENRQDMLKVVRERLANLYYDTKKFEQAAGYLNRSYSTAKSPEEKKVIVPKLLDAYLRWPNIDLAVELVSNCLSDPDLNLENDIIHVVDNYLLNQPVGADPNMVLESLSKIKLLQPRRNWQEQLSLWMESLEKTN